MTSFVESCVTTVASSARTVARRAKGKPSARRLLRALAGKKNILVTTHRWPDPDALASSAAMCALLRHQLKDATVSLSIKGEVVGGINTNFVKLADLAIVPWDDAKLMPEHAEAYDAIVLLDVQPAFSYSPLPAGVMPTAIVDHHRSRGRKPAIAFTDIRVDVGATASIVFSYLMELEVPIDPSLAATLVYAIESDLAGAAGTPDELDNIALSSLMLRAEPKKLYQMRYAPLQRYYFAAFHDGIGAAEYAGPLLVSHLGQVPSPELPAIVADGLLRLDEITWTLLTAIHEGRLILSLRTDQKHLHAGEVMRKLVRKIGEGGGHRNKAGGFVTLESTDATCVDRVHATLRRRLVRLLGLPGDASFGPLMG